mmetsp:Transcript_12/g.20  ORF Transcript_12/g.20 Transcript_12/m.20 type:complete len:607 (-) Transcript_12:283-2103(-)
MAPIFQRNSRFGSGESEDRWVVVRKLGEGQFAEVYEVKDQLLRDVDTRYAVKIEKRKDVKSVRQEYKVLRKLEESCDKVAGTVDCGALDDRFYIVMQLLGANLVEARKGAGGRLSPGAVRLVASSMLEALQAVHAAGYVHRDVKPANFAVYPPNAGLLDGTWKIIDFGLARRFLDDSGEVLPARQDAAFRGSTTYASVHAHMDMDLGRRDDLWSWLYCVVELLEGTLPWRADAAAAAAASAAGGREQETLGRDSRERVRQLKQQCAASPDLFAGSGHLPEPIVSICCHLQSLGFEAVPNYDYIRACLMQLPELAQEEAAAGYSMHPGHMGSVQYMGDYGPWTGNGMPAWGVTSGTARHMQDTPASPVRDTPLSPAEEGTHPQSTRSAGQGTNAPSPYCHSAYPGQGLPDHAGPGPGSWGYGVHPFGDGVESVSTQAAVAMAWEASGRDVAGAHGPWSVAGQDATTAGQHNGLFAGGSFGTAPGSCAPWEERAVAGVREVASAVKQGHISSEAQELARRMGQLHPVDCLAIMASVLQDSTESVDSNAAHALGQALYDLSLFTRHLARRADARYTEAMTERVAEPSNQGAHPGAAKATPGAKPGKLSN